MKRINKLPEAVINMIAAGEVVEGPSSVVKELLENALDSGATEIGIQIFESGMKKILVRDNGSGIHPDDVKLAVCEHATSKIETVYDIESVSSYGFRGEALSSICSVSDMTVLSRPSEIQIGKKLECRNEKIYESDFAGPAGTTVIVQNLFYNIPARKKFLKSLKTEMKNIRDVVLNSAIVNFNVEFSLDCDDKKVFHFGKAKDLNERICQIYGEDFFNNVQFELLEDLKVTISGYLSKPDFEKTSKSHQILFVNGRHIEYKFLSFILSKAYEAVIPKGKYPVAIIFITIDPSLTDVNVHPAKREVRLFDQKYIDSMIFQIAAKVLNKTHIIDNKHFTSASGNFENNIDVKEDTLDVKFNFDYDEYRPSVVADSRQDFDYGSHKIIGSVLGQYIIVEKDNELYFIDFHAAHEREIYDRLIASDNKPNTQELLFPAMVKLSVAEYNCVIDNIMLFKDLGFDIDEFSDNTIIIRSVPELKAGFDHEKFMKEAIDELSQRDEVKTPIHTIAAVIACHSARRAGDVLSKEEMGLLARNVFNDNADMRCPHGRPFVHKISKSSLENIFKRKL